ncbi:hypothetical protein HDU98_000820 [Podochytrium sp. JEL0797]|nr:hypothetical protein HDU98_000820 [Podochytrium sp. JEL0797]
MLSTNTTAAVNTIPTEVLAMTFEQYWAIGVAAGIVFQMAIAGLTATLISNWGELKLVHYIMSVFNVLTVLHKIIQCLALHVSYGDSACELGFKMDNDFSHFYDVSFDVFLLYKSWVVSGYNKWVRILFVLLLLNRCGWTVWDMNSAGGKWDAVDQQCHYYDNALTGLMWNLSDISMDIASTIVSLWSCWDALKTDFGQVAKVIAADNVLRSVVTSAVNLYIIIMGYQSTNPFTSFMTYLIRDWIYVFSLNAELF